LILLAESLLLVAMMAGLNLSDYNFYFSIDSEISAAHEEFRIPTILNIANSTTLC
jgi:hypothetical protein